MKTLKVIPFRQSPGYCGPACLKIVAEYYNITRSETELAELSRCTEEKGASAKNLMVAAKKIGLDGYIKDNSTFQNIHSLLKKKIPVIVDWFSQDGGHYSVVTGLDEDNIYMQDPEAGGRIKIKKDRFMQVWFDFYKEYPKKPEDLIIRRMMVLYKK